jgi:hypothetical protein
MSGIWVVLTVIAYVPLVLLMLLYGGGQDG